MGIYEGYPLCHGLWPLIHRVGESFLSSCAEFCKRQRVSLSFFYLSRGCPLSPLLYVIASEVLAASIRANPQISGLSIPGFPPLSPISQYTDVTLLILTSENSIKACFEVYTLFQAAHGAKLNQAKSKGLWLGQWVGQTDPPVALDWSPTKLKILGVFVGPGDLEEENWCPRPGVVCGATHPHAPLGTCILSNEVDTCTQSLM